MAAISGARGKWPWARAWLVRVLTVALLAAVPLIPAVVAAPAAAAAAAAAPCDPPVVNPVACENTKPGTDSWQVQSPDPSIAGFTTDISVNRGGTVNFKIDTAATGYRVDIYRLGWYGGIGARQVGTLNRTTHQTQPACLTDPPTGLVDCGNWGVSLSWQVPSDAVSGIYYAALRRNDGNGENEIAFVVRDDASTSKIFFQTSDSTWQAYNRYGGNSLYYGTAFGPQGSAYKVSYNRPLFDYGDENFIFNAEYPMLRFLEANGYDVSYTTDADTARRGNLITNHKIFMPVGHDEYWSNEQRNNVEAARAAGVNLSFFTANEVFWKTRWEPSLDTGHTDWRTLVCYKETKGAVDPNPTVWTGTWRDPRFSPPKDGGRPENGLLGNMFTVNGRRDDSLMVPAAYGKMRLWRNTPLANLAAGQSYTFAPGTLGYEWNSVVDNGFTPPGVAQLSSTTVTMDGQYILQNYGDQYGPGTQTHALTLYRDQSSGALVFGAGTVQWSWGLDDEHAFSSSEPTSDVRIKQATVNLFADMGVQPTTLQAGLVAVSASTDTTAPAVAITTAPNGQVAQSYTFSGTVSDVGGRVAGVEVSVDGGSSWHPAQWTAGSGTWSYTFTPAASGAITLKARAVDDSVRLSAPVSRPITISPPDCPCSLWPQTTVPTTPAVTDQTPVELGLRFKADTNGYIRGVKFYKGTGNIGPHTGSLWTTSGTRLATGTFTNETATGWQTLLFPVPVAVTGGTTYIASYFAPAGHYAADPDYFASADQRVEPLTGLRSDVNALNGVYLAGNPGFPSSSYRTTNYWVDVVYALDPGPDTRAPEISTLNPIDQAGSVPLTGPVVAVTFDEPVDRSPLPFTVTGPSGAVPGSLSFSAGDTVVSWTPTAPLAAGTAYTASIRAQDPAGNLMPAARTWSFTTGTPRGASCPCTVWDDFTRPAADAALDTTQVEVGTKVRFDVRGQVLGVRFFKGPGNGGTHTGSLWTANGQRLATGTFANETSHGWQTLTFSAPVNVDPQTTYVVSYYAPLGHYAASGGYFGASGADYTVMHALRDGVDGPNGVYRYGNGGGFPTSTYQGGNYWVDAVFRNGANGDSTPPTMVSHTPGTGSTGVPLSGVVTTTFSEPMDLPTAQYTITDPGGAKLAGNLTISSDQRTVTWTPPARLTPGTAYTVRAQIADINGNLMTAPQTWTFTTVTSQTCPCSLFSAATLPTDPSTNDGNAYELGVRFTTSANGVISGVRFYKGAGNTGTHTGSLWTATGQRLATGTFTGETATGWQTLQFTEPISVHAGQTYVASYTTTVGHYASDSGYFERAAVSSAPLSAPLTSASTPNGVFKSGTGFPESTYGGANYWVDVVYEPPLNNDDVPPSMVSQTPAAGATGAPTTTVVSARFDEPVKLPGAIVTLADVGGAKLTGSLSLSGDSREVLFTPSAPLAAGASYTASFLVSDVNGNLMDAPATWSFTVATSQTCPCSLFSAATVPTITSADDTGAYELGVRFTSSADGVISGVRFYKGTGNTGTHTGSLWSADGQRLATGTFTGETATGWQTLTFATPVPVTAGQSYVASYTTTTGHYASDSFYFEQGPAVSSPLTAPATGGGGVNGVYAVGSGFPTQSFRGGNYWVDVVFTTG